MTNEEYHKHDETNRLIAEFMGLETVQRHPRTQEWTQVRFDYHNSWDGLMPVVRKIDQVCGIDLHEWDEYLNDALCTKELSVVHGAVVEFIIWYNQNK